jgi:hypothetical protein
MPQFSKHGKVWAVRTSNGELIYILPPCVLDEIKVLPPSKASFIHVFEEVSAVDLPVFEDPDH